MNLAVHFANLPDAASYASEMVLEAAQGNAWVAVPENVRGIYDVHACGLQQ